MEYITDWSRETPCGLSFPWCANAFHGPSFISDSGNDSSVEWFLWFSFVQHADLLLRLEEAWMLVDF